MKIKWNGHACFTITLSDGQTITTDPFDSSVGYIWRPLVTDYVTISHGHHDHNSLESLAGYKTVLSEEGEYRLNGFTITLFPSFHDEVNGQKRGNNLLCKIQAEGKTIVHLGDLGHIPTPEQAAFLSGADIMLIPIGGTYTITTEQAVAIVNGLKPKCCIPMHFLTPVMNFPITDEKNFVKAMNGRYLNACEADVNELFGCVVFDYVN